MSARVKPTASAWVEWVEAEALLSGWLSVRPYARVNNRAGAPDVILARDGRVIALWVRPEGHGLTQAQVAWEQAMCCAESVEGVLAHPTVADRDVLRGVLA